MQHPSSSSELRYRDFFESVAVGLFAIAPDGRILDANPALVSMFGYSSREQLLDSDIADFQIDPAVASRLLSTLRTGGEVSGFEIEFDRSDDTTVSLVASARAARDEAGRILYYQGAVEDITARRLAEEAARASEHRFEAFMNHTPVIAYIKDEEGRYHYGNDPCLHFLGKKRHELYGLTDHDIFPPSVANPLRAHDRAVVGEETGLQTIEILPGPNGEMHSFMVLKFPITDTAERKFVGGFALDITDRRRAEEAERRLAQRFRDLFDSSPDAIFVQDLEGNILDANPVACSICGQPHAKLIGRNMSGLIPADSLADLLHGPHLASGEVTHAETIIRAGDGRLTPVAISSSRIEFTGRPALVIHARDTSEQKKLQEQFHQSQKMEAIGCLAGGIAHDFNNLLTAIIGYNELVLGGLHERDPLRRSSEEVRKAAERAARLTRQLLAVSRKQTLQPRVLDVNSCVSEIEKMLRRLLGDDVELSVFPSPTACCVKADPSQLEQVLMNLAVNARDAMPAGGQLFIHISCVTLGAMLDAESDMPPGDYVLLKVIDTGTGMTDETRARIFEPFFTTKDPGKGTGLGLATCYGIVKQSGGRIFCDSSPNCGTTFSIYLPQVVEKAEPAGVELSTALPRGTGTILLVEDAIGVRALASRVLGSLGYKLIEAENGLDALSVLSRHSLDDIDLILTDVTMPKMGGRELVERIRAEHPAMRVIFTSGNPGADAGFKTFLSQPGTAFLHKPFTPADLARVVRTVMTEPLPLRLNGSSYPVPEILKI